MNLSNQLPAVCVLVTDGVNDHEEAHYAFEAAGAKAEYVHVNQLRDGDRKLNDFQALVLSGGFSYGDDITSGKVLASELTSFFSDELQSFVDAQKPVLGICNGFQVLVRSGLLPNRKVGDQKASLVLNDIGRYECRWVELKVEDSVCRFVDPKDFDVTMPIQTAHAEGKFFATEDQLESLRQAGQVVFRYANSDGTPASGFPQNPNGSLDNVAGICDPSGLVLGLMPHPERSMPAFHPDRKRTDSARQAASRLFSNIVGYAQAL